MLSRLASSIAIKLSYRMSDNFTVVFDTLAPCEKQSDPLFKLGDKWWTGQSCLLLFNKYASVIRSKSFSDQVLLRLVSFSSWFWKYRHHFIFTNEDYKTKRNAIKANIIRLIHHCWQVYLIFLSIWFNYGWSVKYNNWKEMVVCIAERNTRCPCQPIMEGIY